MPNEVVVKPWNESQSQRSDKKSSDEEDVEDKPKNLYIMKDKSPVTVSLRLVGNKEKRFPTIFIINRLSGPQFGDKALEFLYQYFNPIQIIDLIDEGLHVLDLF